MKKYKTQYAVVRRNNKNEFEAAVRTFLDAGWFLQGGVAIDRDDFAQALFRTVEVPEVLSADEKGQEPK